MSARKSHSKEHTARTPQSLKGLISDDPLAIVAKISISCWCKRVELPRKIFDTNRIKDSTDALWGCQELPSRARLPFWSSNSPNLNPLDYYVWSVVERVTNKSRHPNMMSLRTAIEAAFVDMNYMRYITTCVQTFQVEKRHSS